MTDPRLRAGQWRELLLSTPWLIASLAAADAQHYSVVLAVSFLFF